MTLTPPTPREGDLVLIIDQSDLAHGLHAVVAHVFEDGLHCSLLDGAEEDEDDVLVLYQPEQVVSVFPVKVQLGLFGASGRREVLVYNQDKSVEVDSMSPEHAILGSKESVQALAHMSDGKPSFYVLAHVDPTSKMLQISQTLLPDQGW